MGPDFNSKKKTKPIPILPPPPYCESDQVSGPISCVTYNAQKKHFCGHEAKRWSIFTGLMQIIFGVCVLVLAVVGLSAEKIIDAKGQIKKASLSTWLQVTAKDEMDQEKLTYFNFISDPNWQLLYAITGLSQGSILLAGIFNANILLLTVWFIASVFILIFFLSLLIIPLFLFVKESKSFYLFIFAIVLLKCGLETICFSFVSSHRKELMSQLTQLRLQHSQQHQHQQHQHQRRDVPFPLEGAGDHQLESQHTNPQRQFEYIAA